MRALLLVLDSVGCGHAPDAAAYGDAGANTLGHIHWRLPELELPTLQSLGLGEILARDSIARSAPHTRGAWGTLRERSAGKDTTTGHWELAGAVLEKPFATFAEFPADLVRTIEREAGCEFLGGFPASGTAILDQLGAEHVATGRPILYTSADSVMQIAAHESVVPLARLYAICEIARRHCDAHRIGRVIARPFIGEPGAWMRTAGRHDYSMAPPPTVLDALAAAGQRVRGIGKISDIFAGHGISDSTPTANNAEGMAAIERLWSEMRDGLLFANLVDFDSHFGHRRDVPGYGQALLAFDDWLGIFLEQVRPDDLVLITADHGNDPVHHGTDHTREEVPLFALHCERRGELGTGDTFADVAATLAEFFELAEKFPPGVSFLPELRINRAAAY